MDKKILIVEDNEQDQLVLERILTKAGYPDLVFASRGEAGIEKAKSEAPALIILDVNLPGMPGSEVANRLQSHPRTRNIPIIFNTCLLRLGEEAGNPNLVAKENVAGLLKQIKEKIG